jgi:hypothetical protein
METGNKKKKAPRKPSLSLCPVESFRRGIDGKTKNNQVKRTTSSSLTAGMPGIKLSAGVSSNENKTKK